MSSSLNIGGKTTLEREVEMGGEKTKYKMMIEGGKIKKKESARS